ncbi:MAG: hypothetical protein HY052_08955 [Proteobacteria bacterium]|nr:hypothetical protein [Pseudomonadota bacterium]
MHFKKTLMTWSLASLLTVFGTAAGYSQSKGSSADNSTRNNTTAVDTTTTKDEAESATALQNTILVNAGPKELLTSNAKDLAFEAAGQLKFKRVGQIKGLEDILNTRLPLSVRNRIAVTFNKPGNVQKIIKPLTRVIRGTWGEYPGFTDAQNDNEHEKNGRIMDSWENDPKTFAVFLGKIFGLDFYQPLAPQIKAKQTASANQQHPAAPHR